MFGVIFTKKKKYNYANRNFSLPDVTNVTKADPLLHYPDIPASRGTTVLVAFSNNTFQSKILADYFKQKEVGQ